MASSLDQLWAELAAPAPTPGPVFHAGLLDGVPGPARRWLARAIAPGTPLREAVLLRMHGTLRLQRGRPPLPMQAEQVLAPPRGFVWRARVGRGLTRISGYDRYDGRGELRWRLLGIVPVMRAAGPDVDRSAAGRLAGEAALVPAVLVRCARWEPVDDVHARARLEIHGEDVAFTVRVAPDGALQRVVIARWNGQQANGDVGYLPFVVDFGDERSFGGYTIPTRLAAGWAEPGSEQADPFFHAVIDDAEYR